jgi:diguanylate cyclase (GGDEF)-like protein
MELQHYTPAEQVDGEQASPGASRGWLLLPGSLLVLAAVYVVLPYGQVTSALYVGATLLAAVFVIAATQCRTDLHCPSAWRLIAGGLLLGGIGHLIWYWLDLRGLDPFPSIADVMYLAIYPLFAAALWKLGYDPERRNSVISDTLMLGVSAVVLGWAVLIAPFVLDPDLTWLQLAVATAYPIADLMLIPLLLRLVFLHRMHIRTHQFLLIGMLSYFAADLLYAHGTSTGWYAPGGFTDSLWLIAYALFIAGAWHPSARQVPQSQTSDTELTGRRLFVLCAGFVLVPGIILFTAGDEVTTIRIAATGSIILFLLVTYRMAGLLHKTQKQAEKLEDLTRLDALTGAFNRRHLDTELAREISRAERMQTPFALAFFDVDHFKEYNDHHGHSAGDTLLIDMVAAWQGELRPTDILTRSGGEEFVVLFPDTDIQACFAAVERLREKVPLGQKCSAGIAAYHPGESAHDLLQRADEALYRAKNGGRDRAVIAPDPPQA